MSDIDILKAENQHLRRINDELAVEILGIKTTWEAAAIARQEQSPLIRVSFLGISDIFSIIFVDFHNRQPNRRISLIINQR